MRRPFFEFHASTQSPLAAKVLAEIARPYAIEAEICGQPAERRRQLRQERSRPIVEALHAWLLEHVQRVSGVSDLAKAIRYALRHWSGLTVFLDDGRIDMDTNVVERAIRPHTLTRKNALFAGSDVGTSYCSPDDVVIKQGYFGARHQTSGAVIAWHRLRDGQLAVASQQAG